MEFPSFHRPIFSLYRGWQLTKDKTFEHLCTFDEAKEPTVELTLGRDTPICQDILSGKVPPLAYTGAHTLDVVSDDASHFPWKPLPGVGRTDLDHDGRVDTLVRFSFESGARRGCDTMYVMATDANGESIPDSPLNKVLRHFAGAWCGPMISILEHDDTALIEEKFDFYGNRTIYKLDRETLVPVCQFTGRPVTKVVWTR